MNSTVELKPAQRIEAVARNLGLSMVAVFLPWSRSRNAGEKQPSLNWQVSINKGPREVLMTDYTAGCGYCPGYRQGDHTIYRDELVRWECEHGLRGYRSDTFGPTHASPRKHILPDFHAVLASLVLDSDVLEYGTFEEWAENFGYDGDSRKAEGIYRACLEIALKLRGAIGDEGLRALREACQDY